MKNNPSRKCEGRYITKNKGNEINFDEHLDEGAIKGKLLLVPNHKNVDENFIRQDQTFIYDNKNDKNTLKVQISEDRQQHRNLMSQALTTTDYMKLDQTLNTVETPSSSLINRSKSFTNSTQSMDMLNATDTRRYSCASDVSLMSSTSSLSDIWTSYDHGLQEQRKLAHSPNTGVLNQYEEYSNASKWRRNQGSQGSPYSWETEGNDQHFPLDNSTFNGKRSLGGLMDSQYEKNKGSSGLRCDTGLSDLTGYARLPSFGFHPDKEFISEMGSVEDRRDSVMSNFSDRRSSGFSSDSDRRDSNASIADRYFHSNTNITKSASSSGILNSSNMHDLKEEDEKTSSPKRYVSIMDPCMIFVPEWLKSLRLHKYTSIIMSFTYEQMLELTDEKLERLNITKGARRKIISSIQKLKERGNLLSAIIRDIENVSCDVKKVLTDLEAVLRSPIKLQLNSEMGNEQNKVRHNSARDSGTEVSGSEDDEDHDECIWKPDWDGETLIERLMTTLRKVCSLLLLSQNTDPKHVSMFTNLLDICLSREVFQPHQKQLMLSWRHKIISIWGHLPPLNQVITSQRIDRKFLPPQAHIPAQVWGSCQQHTTPRHSIPNRETQAMYSAMENLHCQERQNTGSKHPLLLQRKSAPNIRSWQDFSTSPVTYRKRSSFQCATTHDSEYQHLREPGDTFSLSMFAPPTSEQVFERRDEEPRLSHNSFPSHPEKHLREQFLCEPQQMVTNIFVTSPETPAESELNTRLESLCLSVTEHALS